MVEFQMKTNLLILPPVLLKKEASAEMPMQRLNRYPCIILLAKRRRWLAFAHQVPDSQFLLPIDQEISRGIV